MMQLILVASGGAIGSVSRYLLQKAFNSSFPVGTLSVNLLGCFLIGILWATSTKSLNEQVGIFLMTGFCGGFTTFSAFSLESVQMMLTGRWMHFSLYILASMAGGLLATFLGFKIFS